MTLEIKELIANITAECKQKICIAADSTTLYDTKVEFLGKSGRLTAVLRGLKDVPNDQKPAIGQLVNDAKEQLEQLFLSQETKLSAQEMAKKIEAERIDISINHSPIILGKPHPLDVVLSKITSFFAKNGFSVEESREIETTYYNFDALNTPADHPAREAQDTFFLDIDPNKSPVFKNLKKACDQILLRSQTSTGQIRMMEKVSPPIKMISPGRVFRADEADATHTPCFHQLEGLVVGEGINMGHLKGTILEFVNYLFDTKNSKNQTKLRFRPSFFPFTEPSVEVDASCFLCDGADDACRVCKGSGFIEIMGAGMVNRNVLTNVGIDPDVYTGFAFGMGLDRVTAIIHGISDARVPFEGDIRFLKQF